MSFNFFFCNRTKIKAATRMRVNGKRNEQHNTQTQHERLNIKKNKNKKYGDDAFLMALINVRIILELKLF